ncbi:MAG: hypothetical protein ACKV2V_03660 [Blastocatellia bacterium]
MPIPRSRLLVVLIFVTGVIILAGGALPAGSAPQDHEAIQYEKGPVSDAVWQLQQQLDSGKTKLVYDEHFGWLRSVLEQLQLPVASQILNFGKTSFQAPRISPRRPRAIYFNDQVSLGYVHNGEVLELAALDPRQGVIFYTLDQAHSNRPRFQRNDTCLQCHANNATLNTPGLLIRSIYPQTDGMPLFHAGGFVTDHRSPLKERWGGWYVTGTHGAQPHMGNAFVRDVKHPDQLDFDGARNLTSLKSRFNAAEYLSPHSDIVALMVIEHQTRMTNLLINAGWETRRALHYREMMRQALGELSPETAALTERRIRAAGDQLLEYMLFVDEAPLTEPVRGTSGFAEWFAKQGPADAKGRSFRQLDLTARLFRYPCSFLIYAAAFDNLPAEVRDDVYRKLWDVLNGQNPTPRFARLGAADRAAIREILIETKPGLPDYWRK